MDYQQIQEEKNLPVFQADLYVLRTAIHSEK
jgi:hypothetical protein